MKQPVFHGAYIAPTAIVNGDVTLDKDVNIWYGAVVRGDMGAIKIGEGTNIQDNCVVHEEVTVGKNCTVGHGAILHGCTVGDNCLIGMGAIVLNGAVLGDSLRRILSLAPAHIYPGHGTDAAMHDVLRENPYLKFLN